MRELAPALAEGVGGKRRESFEIERMGLAAAMAKREAMGDPREVVSKYMETKANYLSVKAEMAEAEFLVDAAALRSMPKERIRDWRRGGQ